MQDLELENKKVMFEEEGQLGGVMPLVIGLFIGLVIVSLVTIFGGVLGGTTYQQVEPDLDAITNSNVRDHAKNAIINSFEAQEDTANLLPVVGLAVVMFLVMSLVIGFSQSAGFGGRGGGGTAL